MTDDPACNRHFAIALLRLSGALLVMFGMVIAAGKFQSIPPAAGIVMIVVGSLDFALVPVMLARRWRSPK
jgi:hypothetical protein